MGKTGVTFKGERMLRAKIGRMTRGAGKGRARIGTNVEYGPYVELGTSRMRAQPYLRPALDAKRSEAIREVADVLALNLTGGLRIKAALHAGGLLIQNEAKILVPVDTHTLQSSITTEATEG